MKKSIILGHLLLAHLPTLSILHPRIQKRRGRGSAEGRGRGLCLCATQTPFVGRKGNSPRFLEARPSRSCPLICIAWKRYVGPHFPGLERDTFVDATDRSSRGGRSDVERVRAPRTLCLRPRIAQTYWRKRWPDGRGLRWGCFRGFDAEEGRSFPSDRSQPVRTFRSGGGGGRPLGVAKRWLTL